MWRQTAISIAAAGALTVSGLTGEIQAVPNDHSVPLSKLSPREQREFLLRVRAQTIRAERAARRSRELMLDLGPPK